MTAGALERNAKPLCWVLRPGLMEYQQAVRLQESLHAARCRRDLEDALVLLQHPPTITLGSGASFSHLRRNPEALAQAGYAVHRCSRGGDVTFHGPGQLVGYPLIDLGVRGRDVHKYLRDLEAVIILLAQEYGIEAQRIPGLTGVWVEGAKVAAIGVCVRRWVTMHGFALNANNSLEGFQQIVPCGLSRPVTSLAALLERQVEWDELEQRTARAFAEVFGCQVQFVTA